jgi:CotS family spore coat protein
VDYSLEDLNFINSGVKFIKKSFDRVLDFVPSTDNKPYTIWKNDIYCIMDLVPGRECDFNNPIDLGTAAKGLGELHKASAGFKAEHKAKNLAGRTLDIFQRRLQEMEFFKSLANLHECKTEFDSIFLENEKYHVNEIKQSIKLLETIDFDRLCAEDNKVVLCHHDLAYHNILINDDKAYFIDFDNSIVDLKVHDLCNFITKSIKNFAFDCERATSILYDYCSENSLTKEEIQVLYGMLYFPEDFYTISRDYYTRRKDWEDEVFIDRLRKKVSFKEDRSEFLEEFRETILS